MFGHPGVLTGDGGSDTQSQAFFAEQGVTTVTGTEGPDFRGFREVANVLLFIAGPSSILLTGFQRRAYGVQTGNEGAVTVTLRVAAALSFVFQTLQNFGAHLGHDAHVDYNVGRVGNFNTNLGQRRVQGAHAEGDNVHGAALHAALEETREGFFHFGRGFPVVGRTCVFFLLTADEGAVFHTCYV